jgi:hypothetical protein
LTVHRVAKEYHKFPHEVSNLPWSEFLEIVAFLKIEADEHKKERERQKRERQKAMGRRRPPFRRRR